RLGPAAILAAGFDAGLAELLDQVGDGLLFAGRRRRAALEGIRGQHLHVAHQRVCAGAATGTAGCECRQQGQQEQETSLRSLHLVLLRRNACRKSRPIAARVQAWRASRSSHAPRPCALISMSPPSTAATRVSASAMPWARACST